MTTGDVNTTKEQLAIKGQKVINMASSGIGKTLFTLKDAKTNLFNVGKPVNFPENIDPDQRIRNHLVSKMNVIDLIPCDYMIPLSKAMNVVDKDNNTQVTDAFTPQISYGDAVDKYRNICRLYGLTDHYGGLRLYLTDETTATDDFSNSYQDNFLQTTLNAFTDITRQMREVGRSVTSTYDKAAGQVVDYIADAVGNTTGSDKAKNLAGTLGEVLAIGNRIALPKLWSDSTYRPNMSAVVKLVSPFGHPSAIKEFIIKPLMHLLLMSSATTRDGITYGQSPKLTIKGYGITHIPLGHIASINLRKGGADTSYNIYRQPLSIDVSISFETLVDGFACNSIKEQPNIFHTSDRTDDISGNIEAGNRALFQTLETVVASLKPVKINKITEDYNAGTLFSTNAEGIIPGDNGKIVSRSYQEQTRDDTKILDRLSKTSIPARQSATIIKDADESVQQQANAIADAGDNTKMATSRST